MPLSKNDIKYIKSLRLKKFRQKYNNFVVEGDKIVGELVQQRPEWVESLYALDEWVTQMRPAAVTAQAVSRRELEQASHLKTPNQALAVVRIPDANWQSLPLDQGLSLYLDGLQDPGNMGTILRIADWFGLAAVLCSPHCVDVYNPKVLQASMGAFLRVNGVEADLESVKSYWPELPVYAAALQGEDVMQMEAPQRGIIAIGNEGAGLTEGVMELATHPVTIARARGSKAESLNAAVATGIICAAFRRS